MKRSIASFILLFAFVFSQAQEKFIVRIDNPNREDFKKIYSKEYDIAAYSPRKYIDLIVDKQQSEVLQVEGFIFKTIQTEAQVKNKLVAGKALDGYRTYEDVLLELQQIEAANPGICKLYDIGETRGKEYSLGGNSNYDNYNHESWALKVSDNVETEEDEPAIYYFGAHHAREPISVEVTMYILNHILANYGSDPDITYDVNNKQIWFVPLVNPNGHKIVIDELDVWQRKNIADNDGDGQIDLYHADGVDPNRNYAWEWGGGGSSGNPGNELYRGPSPFSEPETQAIRDLMFDHHFIAGITYHSHGELVLYPNGYSSGATARDHDALEDLAVNMATNIPGLSGGNYTPEEGWQLYPADGVTDDYAYGQHGIFSFTIELGQVFIPPQGDILTICQDNLQAAMILLDRVDQNTLTGLVKDANTLLPVEAEIFIDGIDNTGVYKEPYLSDLDFGRYYRFLLDGNYDVTFSAYGYIPQTFTGININGSGQTILNVNLVPAQTVTVTGTVTDLDTGLPIENATIEVLNTPLAPVLTNASGDYTISNIMEGTFDFRVYAIDYSTIIEEVMVTTSSTVFDFQLQESNAWSFETGTFEPEWVFSGSAPWTITTENPYDGLYCSKSGAIGNQQTSEMEVTLLLTSGGDVSFFRKVSSEATYDFLKFYIDGVQQDQWSGELDWEEVQYAVTSGSHTFKWVYEKDYSVANGSDCGWVDYINFPPYAPSPDPPDIDVNPASLQVTLPPDDQTTEIITISNTGDLELDFSITKFYPPTNSIKAYCTSVGGGSDEYIQNVTIGSINNTTGQDYYTDYTASLSTVVVPGQSYPITVTNGDPIWSSDQCGIWIDWNQNEDFLDDDPITVSGTPGVGPYTATIIPPAGALPGSARMRIQIIYNSTPDPCDASFSYGEVEDYTLVVDSDFTDWLSFNPETGTIPGSGTTDIDINIDATDMDEGDYYADLNISSNDPDEPLLTVPVHLIVSGTKQLELTVFLEGPFTGSEMSTLLNLSGNIPLNQPFNENPWNYSGTESVASIPNSDVIDWVLIELRDAPDAASATPATIIGRHAGFLLKDGTIKSLDGFTNIETTISVTNQLFVVLYSRNHLGIMSSIPVALNAGKHTYDFSIGDSQAYGGVTAQKEISTGIWGMISGDANGDGQIDTNDNSAYWDTDAGASGYLKGDLNLDGQVNNQDKNDKWLPNLGAGSFIPQ